MSYRTSRAAVISVPYITTSPGFQPTWIEFEVGPKNGSSSTSTSRFTGSYDGTRMNYISTYRDSSGTVSKDGNTRMLSVWERVGGNMQEVLYVDSCTFNASGYTLGGLANADYFITVRCGN